MYLQKKKKKEDGKWNTKSLENWNAYLYVMMLSFKQPL